MQTSQVRREQLSGAWLFNRLVAQSKTNGRQTPALVVGVFVFGLLVALSYHFIYGHPKITLIYDARGYLSTTGQVTQFLLNILHLKWSTNIVTDSAFLSSITTDGPVLPSFFAMIFTTLGKVPIQSDWRTIETLQSVLHGATCTLVFCATRQLLAAWLQERFDESKATGLLNEGLYLNWLPVLTAIMWAVYPAAVINSGRYYTETLFVFLMMTLVAAASGFSRVKLRALLIGLTTGLIVLMKPALIFAAVLTACLYIYFSKTRLSAFLIVFVSAALVLAPWAAYTSSMLGRPYLTTPRNSSYNIAMGADTEADGLMISPPTPLTEMFLYDPEPINFMAAQWKWHTQEYLYMLSHKIPREFGYLWNDFRSPYFGLDCSLQQSWHLIMIFLGLCGAFIGVATQRNRNATAFLVCCIWMVAPCVYLLFEANTRYGFTMVPLCAILGSLLFCSTALCCRGLFSASLLLSIVAISAFFTYCLYKPGWPFAPHNTFEVEHRFDVGCGATRTIRLPEIQRSEDAYDLVLLVDGNREIETADLTANGRKLPQKLRPLRCLAATKYAEHYVLRELGSASNVDADDFRQWRAVTIPANVLKWGMDNEIVLRFHQRSATIYGVNATGRKQYPSIKYYCSNKFCNVPAGLETRPISVFKSGNLPARSSIIASNGNKTPLQDDLRIYVGMLPRMLSGKGSVPADQTAKPMLEKDITAAMFSVHMRTDHDSVIQINKYILQLVSPVATVSFDKPKSANKIKVSLAGSIKGSKKNSKAGILLAFPDGYGRFIVLPENPNFVQADTKWAPFEIEDEVPLSLLKDKHLNLSIGIYPGPWLDVCGYGCDRASSDIQIKAMKLSVSELSGTNLDFDKATMLVY